MTYISLPSTSRSTPNHRFYKEFVDLFPLEATKATSIADTLWARWGEPQRRYHTQRHLLDMVARLRRWEAPPLVVVAAWFHDAVYDPTYHYNEEASAVLVDDLMHGLASTPKREALKTMVMATKRHNPLSDDLDSQLLCDADLAVLAAPPAAYRRYATKIREEYSWVPEELWRPGRARVLEHLLDSRLYHTRFMRGMEPLARKNLEDERQELLA